MLDEIDNITVTAYNAICAAIMRLYHYIKANDNLNHNDRHYKMLAN